MYMKELFNGGMGTVWYRNKSSHYFRGLITICDSDMRISFVS